MVKVSPFHIRRNFIADLSFRSGISVDKVLLVSEVRSADWNLDWQHVQNLKSRKAYKRNELAALLHIHIYILLYSIYIAFI